MKNVILFPNDWAESSRRTNWPVVSNLTNGKYLILVAQGSTNRTRTIAVVTEIITLILLADINLFLGCMFQLSNTRIQER